MTRDTGASGALEALAWRGWVVLGDRTRRGGATLDHVLIGPGGVFVVSRLRWPGPVAVVDGELHLAGRPSPRDISDVSEAAGEVLAMVPEVPVHPVLCLERHEPVTGWVRNVMVCGSSNVEEILTTRPSVLGPEQVRQVADVLEARLRPVPAPVATGPAPRSATPWPIRLLLQAVTMATAALLVVAVLQTGVVAQISTVVGDLVTEVATVDDEPRRRSAPDPAPDSTAPRQAPGESAGQAKRDERHTQKLREKRQKQRLQEQRRGQDRAKSQENQRRDRPGRGRSRHGRGP